MSILDDLDMSIPPMSRAKLQRLIDSRPAFRRCPCGSWHHGTEATARTFENEHRTCRTSGGR